MAVLAMDTATQVLAVAVGTAGRTLASAAVLVPRGHSRLLQPTVAELLQMCGLTARDVEAIGVGIGPGSYTGVRLAVSTAKAMAMALDLPLTPVSTLRAIAGAACPGTPAGPVRVVPLLFARRGRAFGAIYDATPTGWACRCAPRVLPVAEWAEQVRRTEAEGPGAPVLLVHDFAAADAGLLRGFGEVRRMALADVAGGIGPALLDVVARGEVPAVTGDDIHRVAPDYTLRALAEVKWEQKDGVARDGTNESGRSETLE
jgi:tRNA threonylcarbamoyladenosine biosynthesis protein TsaB